MTADADLHLAAALVGRSYSWFARHWRTLAHDATGAPFPRPYIGAQPGQRPRWTRAAIDAWKAGAQPVAGAQTSADLAQRGDALAAPGPANDAADFPPSDDVADLVHALGG